MKPFLVLQLRPETQASDDEFDAILDKGGLDRSETTRIRLDRENIPDGIRLEDHAGIIVGGGPGCVSDTDDEKTETEKRIEDAVLNLMPAITDSDFPFLGCCYGIGILGHHLGANVGKERYGEEVGAVACQLTEDGKSDPLLEAFPDEFMAFVGHKEALQELPDGCAHLLASGPCPFQMIRFKTNVYATQFHPEADSQVFESRINIYKNNGYFPPASAETLIASCHQQDVRVPGRILQNFVQAYRRS
ncbi:MAG: glutamine amidotransferase [Alphaproteobacteria bacterium]|nr:glutamine amidotransferase [Alphaproteobacteria bacterium]